MPTLAIRLFFCTLFAFTSNATLAVDCEVSETTTEIDAQDFGDNCDMDGDLLVVGAPSSDLDSLVNSGAVFVFRFDGTDWVEEATLTASDAAAGDEFGAAVAVSSASGDDIVVVGAPDDDHLALGDAGAAYVFRYNGTTWVEEQILTASDEHANQHFGFSVDVDGEVAAVGCPDHTVGAVSSAGAVYVYRYDGTDWDDEEIVTPNTPLAGNDYGRAVALDGDTMVVGAPFHTGGEGIAYFMEYDGTTWDEDTRFTHTFATSNANFGAALDIDGDLAAIASPQQNFGGLSAAGIVYTYRRVDGDWEARETLRAETPTTSNRFGEALRVLGESVAVGEQYADPQGTSSGEITVFHFLDGKWRIDRALSRSTGATLEYLGRGVALSEDWVVGGAPGADEFTVFSRSPELTACLPIHISRNVGDDFTLEAFFDGTLPLTYEWTFDGTALAGETSSELTYDYLTTSDSGEYVVTATDGDSCSNHSNTAILHVTDPCNGEETAKLIAPDAQVSDQFSSAVAIDGDVMVIGSSGNDPNAYTGAGAAYVYRHDGTRWEFEQKLTYSVLEDSELLGASVDVYINVIVVGMPGYDNGRGAAVVYRYNSTEWVEEAFLQIATPVANDSFGARVAVSGGFIAVSAPNDDHGTLTNAGSVTVFEFDGTDWNEDEVLTASDGRNNDRFGDALDIRGPFNQRVFVGAREHDHGSDVDCGAVYVFNNSIFGWSQIQEILPSALYLDAGDNFGKSVSVDGLFIAIGAWTDDHSSLTNPGAVYIYEQQAGVGYVLNERITQADGSSSDLFGTAVALVDGFVAISSVRGGSSGADTVFLYEDRGTTWTLLEEYRPESVDATDQFGEFLAFDDTTILCSSRYNDTMGNLSGAAFVYEAELGPRVSGPVSLSVLVGDEAEFSVTYTGTETVTYEWRHNGLGLDGETSSTLTIDAATKDDAGTYEAVVTIDGGGCTTTTTAYLVVTEPCECEPEQKLWNPSPETFAQFGREVAIEGDVALVSTPFADVGPDLNAGKVHVFRHDGSTWAHEVGLFSSDVLAGDASNDGFGDSVAVSGTVAVVGAEDGDNATTANTGSAYVFRFDGTDWVEEAKLTASDGLLSDSYGCSVAIDGDTIVVGAFGYDHSTFTNAGGAYVYSYDGTSWTEDQILTASDADGGDSFGIDVAIDGDRIVVGAYVGEVSSVLAGKAYVFDHDGTTWNEEAILSASTTDAAAYFGWHVDVEDDTIVVAAESHDTASFANQGQVYVFEYDGTDWNEEQILSSDNPHANQSFGKDVSLSGTTLLIGSADDLGTPGTVGAAYWYEHDGTDWVLTKVLTELVQSFSQFSYAVSTDGDSAIMGAPTDDDLATNDGAAYVFALDLTEPDITDPVSVEACPGDTVVFSTTATGTATFDFQWLKDGTPIDGETSDTLTLTDCGSDDIGSYSVEVTSDVDPCPVISDAAELTLTVEILEHPESVVICTGDTTAVSFSVDAVVVGAATYQWRLDGIDLAGEDGTTLNLGSVDATDAGNYDVEITAGTCTVLSEIAVLTVADLPTIAVEPEDIVTCLGQTVSFSVEVSGNGPFEYLWSHSPSIDDDLTQATLLIEEVGTAHAGRYQCLITDANGCEVLSELVNLSLETAASVESPSDATVCLGSDHTFTVEVSGAKNPTFQWFFVADPKTGAVELSGETADSLTIEGVTSDDVGDYYCEVTDDNDCVISSELASLSTYPAIEFESHPRGADLCVGDSHTFDVEVSGIDLTYQWLKDDVELDEQTDNSLVLNELESEDAGTYEVLVTDRNGCELLSDSAVLTVSEAPSIDEITADISACEGDLIEIIVTASGTEPLEYQWYLDEVLIPGEDQRALGLVSVTDDDEGDYSVEVSNSCGAVTSVDVNLTVDGNPTILAQPLSQEICLDDPVTFEIEATGFGILTYQWRFNGADIVDATDSSYTIDNVVDTDAGNYTCVVTNECGSTTSEIAVLTTNEVPSIDSITGTRDAADLLTMDFSGIYTTGNDPYTFDWTFGDTNTSSDEEPSHTYEDPGTYEVTLTLTNDCGSDEITIEVAVGPYFQRGDCDGNGVVFPIIDVIYLLDYQFNFGPAPPCFDAADVDDDGDVFPFIEAIYLLDYGFNSGPEPPLPGAESLDCGPDETADTVDCVDETCAL